MAWLPFLTCFLSLIGVNFLWDISIWRPSPKLISILNLLLIIRGSTWFLPNRLRLCSYIIVGIILMTMTWYFSLLLLVIEHSILKLLHILILIVHSLQTPILFIPLNGVHVCVFLVNFLNRLSLTLLKVVVLMICRSEILLIGKKWSHIVRDVIELVLSRWCFQSSLLLLSVSWLSIFVLILYLNLVFTLCVIIDVIDFSLILKSTTFILSFGVQWNKIF